MNSPSKNQSFWRKYEPALPIPFHFLVAGVMWIFVGQILISYGISWFQEKVTAFLWLFILASVIGALSIFIFGFSKIAYQNIARLQQKRERICIFAFMEWKSYLIAGFMMGLGLTLRTLIGPNQYLGLMYNAIGGGILLSGLIYFKPLVKALRRKISKKKQSAL